MTSEVMCAELISSHVASDSNNLILKQFQQFDLGAPGDIAWGASSYSFSPYVGPLLLLHLDGVLLAASEHLA
jgi:hypothetical protein